MANLEKLVRGLFDEVFRPGVNETDFDAFDKYFTEAYRWHAGTALEPAETGRDVWREEIRAMIAAFPDMDTQIQDVVTDGERVAVRFKTYATHRGEWCGVPATGKPVQWAGIVIYRAENGKLAEEWSVDDSRGLFEQLGAIPKINSPW